MYFADLLFMCVFLPVCLACYFLARGIKAKNFVLVAFSLIFYAWGEPIKIALFVATAVVNYFLALLIDKYKGRKLGKAFLVIALLIDFGMLAVFKYTDFIIGNINGIFGTSIPMQNIALPLGISFYTFQIVSYMIDVYWEKVDVQRNFGKLLLYISLFPQLVAGPIVRYQTIAAEIDERRTTVQDAFEGFSRVIIGFSKKILFANNLNLIVNACFGDDISKASVAATWIGIIAYSLQVYFDFSGYSDMAIGMGRIFGFHFNENFRYPFVSRSITEYWQRWHISLGSFFRDYLLYVPIFGKRRATLSLFLVWFTTGLWHGASWNYVIWGLYFGIFVFIESKIGKKRLKKVPGVIMHIYTMFVVVIGFGIFKFENMSDLGNFFKNLVGANGNAFTNFANNGEGSAAAVLQTYLFVFIIALIASFPLAELIKKYVDGAHPAVRSAAAVCLTVFLIVLLFVNTAVLVKTFGSNNPYLYFRF